MSDPRVSICIATHDKPRHLERVLESVFRQSPKESFEVIVVDDGSPGTETARVIEQFPEVRAIRVPPHGYRNPAAARNLAYKKARGEVIITQSDDVVHVGEAIQQMTDALDPGTFVLANVWNTDVDGRPVPCHGNWTELVGPSGKARRPIFFLGALWRSDLYAVGGCEERFTAPGREDVYFGECLIHGLGLLPKWQFSISGHHIDHPRPADLGMISAPSRDLYRKLVREGRWRSFGAPWPLNQTGL